MLAPFAETKGPRRAGAKPRMKKAKTLDSRLLTSGMTEGSVEDGKKRNRGQALSGDQKNEGPGDCSLGPSLLQCEAAMLQGLHHAAHSAHAVVMAVAAHGRFFLLLGQIGDGHLGGEHQPGDACGVL